MKLVYIALLVTIASTQSAKGLTLEGKQGAEVVLPSKNAKKVITFADLKEFCPNPPTVIEDECKGSKKFAKDTFKKMEINEINVKAGDLKPQYQKLFAAGLDLLECKVKKDNIVKFSLNVICYYEGVKQEMIEFGKNGKQADVKAFVEQRIAAIEGLAKKKEEDYILLKLFNNILASINAPATA